jgi:GTP-binding protein Era
VFTRGSEFLKLTSPGLVTIIPMTTSSDTPPDTSTADTPEAAGPASSAPEFRSGFVAILGKPNAGKSTLMNAIVGEKVAIVSDKPQTTRDRIAGIFTTDRFQMVFLDTPGVLIPQDRFNEALVLRAADALQGVDVVYHLIDSADREPPNERVVQLLRRLPKSTVRFLVINKIDKHFPRGIAGAAYVPPGINSAEYDQMFMVSALKKQALDILIEATYKHLKPGPLYYDAEQISDRDMRFLASEIVREKVFRRTGAEIPYSVYTETEEFTERADKDYIRVIIYTERDSQKGILIGEGGRVLKDIGQDARRAIERLTGRPCFLELWVKVRKDWRKKDFDLNNFGFKLPKPKPSHKPSQKKAKGKPPQNEKS